jgi:hypothetical protein
MGQTAERQDTTTVAEGDGARSTRQRSLVLVAGPGRSGTSLFTGIMQRLGFYVPQPEVAPDATNPRGFGESVWAVDFHAGLLKRARVHMSDARPAAWARTAQVALDASVQRQLRRWLKKQFGQADDLIIKDPRLSWFLPLWRRCAEDVGAAPRFVTVLRHPAAVIDSKQRSYGAWQGDVSRAASWLNQMLFTERATRDAPRVFVRYDDLLLDWTRVIGRVAEALDLAAIRDAPVVAMRRAHEYVDQSLSRSRSSWDDVEIPAALREQADSVWELVTQLATDDEPDLQALTEKLEAARAAYIDLYTEAEGIAQSSIIEARRGRGSASDNGVVWLVRKVPDRYRRKVPLHWRRAIARVLYRNPNIR